jgi:hypothetical protein
MPFPDANKEVWKTGSPHVVKGISSPPTRCERKIWYQEVKRKTKWTKSDSSRIMQEYGGNH